MAWRGFAIRRGRVKEGLPWLLCALLGVLAAWLLARMLAGFFLAPRLETTRVSHSVAAPAAAPARSIASWHLFGSAPAIAGSRGAEGARTALSIRLRGTLAEADPKAGLAVIAAAGGGERALRVGEEAETGVRLAAVYPDRAVFVQDGVEQVQTLPRERMEASGAAQPLPMAGRGASSVAGPAGSPAAGGGNAVSAPAVASGALRQAVAEARQNPGQLMQRIRIEPVFAGGNLGGVRVSAVSDADAGLLRQAGLQPGDLVTRVDGQPIDSIAHGQQMIAKLASASSVRITVERNGQPVDLTLSLQ